jgi:hypothetical protein
MLLFILLEMLIVLLTSRETDMVTITAQGRGSEKIMANSIYGHTIYG